MRSHFLCLFFILFVSYVEVTNSSLLCMYVYLTIDLEINQEENDFQKLSYYLFLLEIFLEKSGTDYICRWFAKS